MSVPDTDTLKGLRILDLTRILAGYTDEVLDDLPGMDRAGCDSLRERGIIGWRHSWVEGIGERHGRKNSQEPGRVGS